MNIFVILAIISLGVAIISLILALCFRDNEKALLAFIILLLGSMTLSYVFVTIFAFYMEAYLYLIPLIIGFISQSYLVGSFIKEAIL